MRHLNENNSLTGSQRGFRAKQSCKTRLLTLSHETASSLDSGADAHPDLVVLDFLKALDRVPNKCLLIKLGLDGIRGSMFHWIKAFLSYGTQLVMVDGTSLT